MYPRSRQTRKRENSKVEKQFLARIGSFLSILTLYCLTLAGCAYSDVERDVTSNIDTGVLRTQEKVDAMSESSIADTYQNTSQQTKGTILGGAAGGITGYFVPGTSP